MIEAIVKALELLEKKGIYEEMYTSQAKWYEKKPDL